MEVQRVNPQEIRTKVQAGDILLVCAYDDNEKFNAMHLKGAITLKHFKEILPRLGYITDTDGDIGFF